LTTSTESEAAEEGDASAEAGRRQSIQCSEGTMAPSTRSSSLNFEQATDGGWRIIEGGNTRRLKTEELNEYAQMFATTRHENEILEMEKAELEAMMAQKEPVP
jgi:hypothetical protein